MNFFSWQAGAGFADLRNKLSQPLDNPSPSAA